MSSGLISRSPDLRRLRDEGYAVTVRDGLLLVDDVPYLDETAAVRRGTLISTLECGGDVTVRPGDHVAHFAGGVPHDAHGQLLHRVIHQMSPTNFAGGLQSAVSFSSKPPEGYRDYHAKMTAYVRILENQAQTVEPNVSARIWRPVIDEEGGVFKYVDTASSRAGITVEVSVFASAGPVAIVGLGGTGSYILDFVAKTAVPEIHLFDGDTFLQHNAFRAPGAASIDAFAGQPSKAEYWAKVYGAMRHGLIAHPHRLDEANVSALEVAQFVFIAVDDGPARRTIIEHLDGTSTPYIDVGMGLYRAQGKLAGSLRVTTSTPTRRDGGERMPFDGAAGDDPYSTNIQVAELNALNATLAVMRWKRLLGFYADLEFEHQCTYEIDGNHLLNEDHA